MKNDEITLSTKKFTKKLFFVPFLLLIFILILVNLGTFWVYYSKNDHLKNEVIFNEAVRKVDKLIAKIGNKFDLNDLNSSIPKNIPYSFWIIAQENLETTPKIFFSTRYRNLEHKTLLKTDIPINVMEYSEILSKGILVKKDIINDYAHKMGYFKKVSNQCVMGFDIVLFDENLAEKKLNFKYWVIQNLNSNIILSLGVLAASLMIMLFFYIFYIKVAIKIQKELNKKNDFLKESNKRLQSELYSDLNTNLPNENSLRCTLATMSQPKIIIVNIDSFKQMSEYYGEFKIYEIIRQFSVLLSNFNSKYAMQIYKLQEGKFALVEDKNLDVERYEEIAKNFFENFKYQIFQFSLDGKMTNIQLHFTIGIALESKNTFRNALIALRIAKKLKRDYICYFEQLNETNKFEDKIKRTNMILQAIKDNNIVPYFQPIFDKHKSIVKYEALVRIKNENKTVPPAKFLDLAVKTKYYSEIEKMLIEKVLITLKNNEFARISINISKNDMTDGDVSAFIIEKLSQYGVANRVIFELLENQNIEHIVRVEKFIQKVKRMGIKIAIDDFGSGYSNFSYLLKMMPDFIKIDGSIIKNIDKDENSYIIAKAIVSFSKELGIQTIAEFVSSEAIFEKCKEIGIDQFQGFYLSQPLENL